MFRFILKRLLGAIPTLFAIITIAFFLIRVAPGGPFDQERTIPPEIQANLNKVYHLDDPLIVQYGTYLKNILHGDFGPSFQYKDRTVTELIKIGFPVSLKLGLIAIFFALIIGSTLGAIAALKQNSAIDYGVMGLAMTGIAVPNFVTAPLLQLFIIIILNSTGIKILETGGWKDGQLSYMILPVIVLALPQIAYISRMMRGSMIEVLHSNYIRTARAKGLSEKKVIIKHGLRAAMLPIVSYLGPATAAVITGSVVIEQLFGIPGVGRFFVQGSLNRDYTLVMGIVVFYGSLIILFNLLVDIVYSLLDPKVRL
ncbi:MAG: oligopeptide ABC transporter permease OppB [Gammaproteobacteria bacterium]|nr:oligopeptide ABC transporter permease OppB [Gammaproteobacteria bacterium]